MKTCNRCNKTKTYENFRPRKSAKDGYRNQCRVCIEEMRKERRADPLRSLNERESNLQRLYGIGIEEYNEMFSAQEGQCKICQRHQDDFHKTLGVDHCHDTGKIRGLLCDSCNRGIGLLGDSPDLLNRAIQYLTK